MTAFDFQPVLQGPTLNLRPLEAGDHDALSEAAADPLIWAGHPAKTRHLPEEFRRYFDFLLDTGSALIIETPEGEVIGTARYYLPPTPTEQLSIGFTFLVRAHWGGGTNRALKQMMLGHIFASRSAAWFHIDPSNLRSQKATAKLGAQRVQEEKLDLGTGPAHWITYRLDQEDWERSNRP